MKRRRVLLCSTLAAALVVAGVRAQGKPSLIVLEALEIGPPSPGPETLCRLRVRIRNTGGKGVTSFVFRVRFDGQEVSTYKDHVFDQPIARGEGGDVELYNFWTSDPGRPSTRKEQLRVEVALEEASWVEVKRDGNRVEYKTLGSVEGLPVSISRVVPLNTS